MDQILSYEASDEDDYYAILGCAETATVEQIVTEYKIRARELHPDKNPENANIAGKFAQLQCAKEVLCDSVKRKDYDLWRNSGFAMPYSEWCARRASIHTSLHWAGRKTDGRMLENSANDSDSSPEEFAWKSETTNKFADQFRNYQI